ncbi:DUF2939 family protein [Acinetobacter calcoaceticus]|uniref:DUF2939 family protein n=1 Tax=Acinetobacter calcoaceticus TaxID=471 RepID=A0A4R1XS22_ACICA|nr:DUF2939 family protein [Acinetobacter calcoaceticus]
MNKKVVGLIVVGIIAVLGYLIASPYIVLNNIKNAAKAGDSEKISTYIDYPSVRQSFKDQVNAYMLKEMSSSKNDGWEGIGAMFASAMVDKIVDFAITPQGMTMLLQGKDLKPSIQIDQAENTDQATNKPALQYSTRYLSMNSFEVNAKNPSNDSSVVVIMQRAGLSWKVSQVVVPMDKVK